MDFENELPLGFGLSLCSGMDSPDQADEQIEKEEEEEKEMEKEKLMDQGRKPAEVHPDLLLVREKLEKARELEEQGGYEEAMALADGLLEQFDSDFYYDNYDKDPEGYLEFLMTRTASARLTGLLALQKEDSELITEAEWLYEGMYRTLPLPGEEGVSRELGVNGMKLWEDLCDVYLKSDTGSALDMYGLILDLYISFLQEEAVESWIPPYTLNIVNKILDHCLKDGYELGSDDDAVRRFEQILSLSHLESPLEDDLIHARLAGIMAVIFRNASADGLANEKFKEQEKILEQYLAHFDLSMAAEYQEAVLNHCECCNFCFNDARQIALLKQKLKLVRRITSNPDLSGLAAALEGGLVQFQNHRDQLMKRMLETEARVDNFEKLENPNREARLELCNLYQSLASLMTEFVPVEMSLPILEKGLELAQKLDLEYSDHASQLRVADAQMGLWIVQDHLGIDPDEDSQE